VVERIEDMSAGTIGFRSTDQLTDEDFRDHLAPALKRRSPPATSGWMLVTPPSFGSSELKATADLVREHMDEDVGHRSDWKRIAIVTDSGWLRAPPASGEDGPGRHQALQADEEDQAKRWLSIPDRPQATTLREPCVGKCSVRRP